MTLISEIHFGVFPMLTRQFFRRKLDAYGIVEILIALIVIGFLLKGTLGHFSNRFDDAKVKTAFSLYQKILSAVITFQDRYGFLPGDYPLASKNFGDETPNGDGTGYLVGEGLASPQSSKAALFWLHLQKAKLLFDAGVITPHQPLKFGKGAPKSDFADAGFTVIHNPEEWGGHWFVLGSESGRTGEGAAFTPEQARLFLQMAGLEDPQTGSVRVGNGRGSHSCIQQGQLNLNHKQKACIIYFRIEN